jgi:hypothetical protein
MKTDDKTRIGALIAALVRCPPPAGPLDDMPLPWNSAAAKPTDGGASAARQVAGQRQAAAVLSMLLSRAEADGLPPITWTVATTAPVLLGICVACRMDQRRDDFQAWRRAVTAWAHRAADVSRDHADRAGTIRLIEQWDQFAGVTVTLTADIYAED